MQNVYYLYFIFVNCQLKYSRTMYFFYYIAHTLQFCQENSACCFQNINLLQFSSIVQICTLEISTIPRLFDNYEKKMELSWSFRFEIGLEVVLWIQGLQITIRILLTEKKPRVSVNFPGQRFLIRSATHKPLTE